MVSMDDGVPLFGNGIFARNILLEAEKVKSSVLLLLHQWVWVVQATGHRGHIVECIGKVAEGFI
jgi:hypothetical protein